LGGFRNLGAIPDAEHDLAVAGEMLDIRSERDRRWQAVLPFLSQGVAARETKLPLYLSNFHMNGMISVGPP